MRFIFILFVFLLLTSCSDKINQKEEDISKYDYLQPFLLENATFIDGELDIDNNTLQYSYKVTNTKGEFDKIQKKAILNGWHYNKGTFSKYVNIYQNSGENIIVKITEFNNKITFEVESE